VTREPDLPRSHAALVARLAGDARSVRPLRPPAVRLVPWLALAVAVVAGAMAVGLRTDGPAMLVHPLVALELAALAAGAILAAAAALTAAAPGRTGARRLARAALAAALVATALFLVEPTRSLAGFVPNGLRCAFCVGLFGALPWLALFVLVRRGAPLDAGRAAAYVGAAAFLVGAAAVRVACPIDDGLHLVAGHMAPVALGVALSVLLAARALARWRRRPA